MHSSRSFASSAAGGAASSANIFANASAGSASLDPERCSGRWPCAEETGERGEEGGRGRSGEGAGGRRRRMESRDDWFSRDTRRMSAEGRAGAVGGGVPGGREGAGSERESGLLGGPVSESATARGRARGGRGGRARRSGFARASRIRARIAGGFAHLRANHASRGEGGVVVGAHAAAPHAVGRRPARLFLLSARRLVGVVSARARVRAHRAHAARVVVQQRAVRTLPLRRRSSGVAVARHGRDASAQPIGFRASVCTKPSAPMDASARDPVRRAPRCRATRADSLLALARTTSRARVADRALPAAVERLARLGV